MKEKSSFSLLLILIVSFAFATTYDIDFGTNENAFGMLENTAQKLSVSFTFDGMNSFEVESQKGIFNEIIIPKTHNIGEVGTPKLPAMKKLIEIPFGAEVSVNVTNYTISEYYLSDFGINNPIIPVQPSLPKSIEDLSMVEFEFNEEYYSMNKLSAFELANVEVLGVMRGIRLARLVIAPVNYNPVTGVIEVYNNIEVDVNFSGTDLAKSREIKEATYSPYFEAVYEKIGNYRVDHDYPDHPDLTTYPVKYLIVSDRMFESTLADFIEWKTRKGFTVVTAYTDDIGSSASAIQTYVHDQYNAGTPEDPAPSFVLFVGDTGQVPASTVGSSSGKDTDLYYCSVDGDYFPEMYYGRMSATTTTQLQNQIDKILYYEKYEFADPTYLDDVTLIAGADGTWNPRVGQATVIYGTDNYFNVAHGYSQINSYLTSYTGCYDADRIKVGFINYTAHCGETSWSDPSLSQSAVNSFTNANQYPLAIGNCCLAADFGYSECIGETWMRKANGGAVGYIGSSPSSYWFEDFYWSVGAFPISGTNDGYVPTYEETTWGAYDAPFMSDYVSQDALIFVGNLAVTEVDIQGYESHSSPLYYWQAYNTLGDPSLLIYHTQGSVNTVSFGSILPIGADTFTVDAIEGSYVAISMNGVLHGAAMVDATGSVDVPIIAFTTGGTADIVVTKPQYQPEITTVTVAALSGPYVSIDSYVVSADGDDVIEYGETVYLTVTLKNVGTDPATNVNMTLAESDAYISLTDNSESFGTIAADASVTRTNAYTFNVSNTVPDDHAFQLNGTITCTGDSWNPNINLTAFAPVLSIQGVAVSDGDNYRLDPDETAYLVVTIENSGGAEANNIDAILSSLDSYITINDNFDDITSLAASSTGDVTFNVTTDSGTPVGHNADFDVDLTADLGYSATDSFSLTIGLVLEDFETGNFNSFAWTSGGSADWTVVTESPYEGTYCTQSGTITDSQTSELILEGNVLTAGNISFYCKVSSESSYDYLKFFIDDVQQEQWSGTVDWSEVSYAVSAGTREFKWQYYKDGSVSTGSDCAWIDYIIFPSMGVPQPVDISYNPSSFSKVLEVDSSTSDNLTIGNSGGSTLDYTATVSYSTRSGITVPIYNPIDDEIYNGTDKAKRNPVKRPPSPHGTQYPDAKSIRNRDYATIGAGVNSGGGTTITPFSTYWHDGQHQYLFTASELSAAGLVAGTINALGWNIDSAAAQTMNGFNVELKHTTATSVTSFETGFTNCYSGTWTAAAGWNDIPFSTTFEWDGSSNLLVKVCFDNTSYTSNSTCYYDTYSGMNGYAYNDYGAGCSDSYEGSTDSRPQTRFDYTAGSGLNWLTLDGVGSVNGSIAEGSADDVITVGFNSTDLSVGVYDADITITSNDPDEAIIIIPAVLTVSSGGTPIISVYPSSLNFGSVDVGDSSTLQFTIENIGDGTLAGTIDTPAGYEVAEVTRSKAIKSKEKQKENENLRNIISYSIGISSSIVFNVTFEPPSTGIYTGDVVITHNAGGADETVAVSGSGTPPPEPEIDVTPTSVSVTLQPEATTNENLRISNNGEADLTYSISQEDITRGSGGPDTYGYSWIDSNETGGPSYNWIDITSTGTDTGINEDDEVAGPISIGFTFNYYGIDYTQLYISSNGWIGFGTYPASGYTNLTIPTDDDYDNLLAPFWDDLSAATTGDVYYYYDSVNNRFIISYHNLGRYSGTGDYTFQVILNEDGSIKYQYNSMSGTLDSNTVGIENSDGSDGLQVVYNATFVENNLAILFSTETAPDWLEISPTSGTVTASTYDDITLTLDATGMAVGTYEKNVIVTSNDSDEGTTTIPVTMIVSEQVNYPDWEAVTYPNNSATLYGYVTINDVPAGSGDLVGAFSTSECRSAGNVQMDSGTAYITLVIQLENNGDPITFQVYDSSADQVYDVSYSTEADFGEIIGTYPDNLIHINAGDILASPTNIQVSIVGTDITISWDAVSGATYYEVWSSDDPYTGFAFEATAIGATNWSATLDADMKFYFVKAFN